jgi:DNA modification methylase
LSEGDVSEKIKLAKAFRDDPKLKAKLSNLTLSVAIKEHQKIQQTQKIEDQVKRGVLQVKQNLLEGDCLTLIKDVKSNSVDLLLTDPPYGVSSINELADTDGPKTAGPTYQIKMGEHDNLDQAGVRTLLGSLIPELSRVMKPGAYGFMFFCFDAYEFLVQTLSANGFEVDPTPCIWDKGRQTGPNRGYRFAECYEPFLAFLKLPRGRRIGDGKKIFPVKPLHSRAKIHVFEKPIELLSSLIKLTTDKTNLVFDPFAGSGATLEAAMEIGRSYLGFERNHVHYLQAQSRLDDASQRFEERQHKQTEG